MTMHALTVASGKARGVTGQAQEGTSVSDTTKEAVRKLQGATDAAEEEGVHLCAWERQRQLWEREEGRRL